MIGFIDDARQHLDADRAFLLSLHKLNIHFVVTQFKPQINTTIAIVVDATPLLMPLLVEIGHCCIVR